MKLARITAPAAEPVSLAEAKLHLRVIHDAEDASISRMIRAAREHLDGRDGILGRALVTQTWELVLDSFPVGAIQIPLPPLQSITSVKYLDAGGVEQTLDTAEYVVDTASEPGCIAPVDQWPATQDTVNAVHIRFVAGYGDASAVPAALAQAILLAVGDLWANRQTGLERPISQNPAFDALVFPYRMRLLG